MQPPPRCGRDRVRTFRQGPRYSCSRCWADCGAGRRSRKESCVKPAGWGTVRLPQRCPPARTLSSQLDGASVCIQTGTTTELNLADFFRVNGITYEPVPIETNAEARAAYEAERCDVYTTDASGLAATKTTFDDPSADMVFPEIISKEPLGPLARQSDDQWVDIARWTLKPHSLI